MPTGRAQRPGRFWSFGTCSDLVHRDNAPFSLAAVSDDSRLFSSVVEKRRSSTRDPDPLAGPELPHRDGSLGGRDRKALTTLVDPAAGSSMRPGERRSAQTYVGVTTLGTPCCPRTSPTLKGRTELTRGLLGLGRVPLRFLGTDPTSMPKVDV